MRYWMIGVLVVTGIAQVFGGYGEEGPYKSFAKKHLLPMTKDFFKARELAQAYSKPLALVFTGSDWCPYSQKLLKEIIDSEEFARSTKSSFVFVHLDFPELNTHLSPARLEEHYKLKEEKDVKEFPLIVLLDQDLHEITRMGFAGHTSSEYARHLLEALKQYTALKTSLESKNLLTFTDLRQKYLEARELGSPYLIHMALDLGLKQDKACFFHLEKYRLAEGKDKEQWKQKILVLNRDKKNRVGLHLAILDYQERQAEHREDALEPLLEYVTALGPTYETSLEVWRVHMLIAQQLALDGDMVKALEHAKFSLECVPEQYRHDIEHSIKLLSADLIAHEPTYIKEQN